MGAEPSTPLEHDIEALCRAAEDDYVDKITNLLDNKGVPVDSRRMGAYFLDTTPLRFAVSCQSYKAAKLLLDRGADARSLIGYRTPLHTAAMNDDDDMMRMMMTI